MFVQEILKQHIVYNCQAEDRKQQEKDPIVCFSFAFPQADLIHALSGIVEPDDQIDGTGHDAQQDHHDGRLRIRSL